MKNLFIVIVIFFSFEVNSQNSSIPNFDLKDSTELQNNYVKLLKLKDKNSLIINLSIYKNNTKNSSLFLVFNNNGKVLRYDVFYPKNQNDKIIIEKRKTKKEDGERLWSLLNESSLNKTFEIDTTKLNITESENDEGKTKIIKNGNISGLEYKIELIQNHRIKIFKTYEPLWFIKLKVNGYEERQKFLEIWNDYTK